ncbi:MAG: PH domain-containing protein [Actinomycetaceae bacterium]|nr:PH domain-containing protein [Actinomycetaceae bacterium]
MSRALDQDDPEAGGAVPASGMGTSDAVSGGPTSAQTEANSQVEANASAGADEQWHRVSKVTPYSSLLKMWGFIAVAILWFFRERLEDDGNLASLRDHLLSLAAEWAWRIAGIAALVSLATAAVALVVWYFTYFAVLDDGIHLRSGVLIKKRRHMRWDRVQAVNMERKLLARVFGLAGLRVDSGSKSMGIGGIKVGLLRRSQCEALRASILAAADQARAGQPVHVADWQGQGQVADGPAPLYVLKPGRLIGSMVFSPSVFAGAGSLAGSIAWAVWESGMAFVPFLFIFLGSLWTIVTTVNERWATRVVLTRDGFVWRAGLASQVSNTIPPGRIHAVRISQPIMWRPLGWWRLSLLVAGKGDMDTQTDDLVPVGRREEIEAVLAAIVADLGVDDPSALLEEAFEGSGPGRYFVPAPRSSRLIDPFAWKRNGLCLTDNFAVMRRGRVFVRSVRMLDHARFQGLALRAGPVARALGLATLHARTVGTAFAVAQPRMARADAVWAIERTSQLGRQRRAAGEAESIEQWRIRVGVEHA